MTITVTNTRYNYSSLLLYKHTKKGVKNATSVLCTIEKLELPDLLAVGQVLQGDQSPTIYIDANSLAWSIGVSVKMGSDQCSTTTTGEIGLRNGAE